MLNTTVINKLPAFLSVSLAPSLPCTPPLAYCLYLCEHSFNTSILDFLMPTANQMACAAHIWATFAIDKPNLCVRVCSPAYVGKKGNDSDSGFVQPCQSVSFLLYYMGKFNQNGVKGIQLKSEPVTFRDYKHPAFCVICGITRMHVGWRVREGHTLQ